MATVLVCGGRRYMDSDRVYAVLNQVLDALTGAKMPMRLVHGACNVKRPYTRIDTDPPVGADAIAHRWALRHKDEVEVVPYPADWTKHGLAAGPLRNQAMLDEQKPALVIAFPGNKGTRDMVRRARAAHIPLWIVPAKGELKVHAFCER